MKLIRFLTATGLLLGASAFTLQAEIFPVAADANASSERLTLLYGGGRAKTLPVTRLINTYLDFEVGASGIDPASVDAARLILYFPTVTKPGKISLHTLTTGFTENDRTLPGPGAAPFKEIDITAADARQYLIIDVTTEVKAWLTTPGSDHGFSITGDADVKCAIASKEGAGSGHPPFIEVDLGTAAGGVTTALIADGAVTSPKLALDLTLAGITKFTGNVGIGTATPEVPLDLLYAGTQAGLRLKSSADLSALDIDAFNGEAALRFLKDGVGQWNIRNRPADDYLEFLELGGGGSRMVIQDGTGNVGIGGGATVSPAYRLDVEHGGATGIRSKSTGTFSVIDIDAANGDAALRFARAGVNQWNTRNRPADNYYEIFELGGGGSRFVIQDATGNVGIGATTNPAFKLDILHDGTSGIRCKSSSNASVIDIDAESGDAALRLTKAGVNQWSIGNRPADDYFEIFELGGGGSRVVVQDGTGNVGIGATTVPTYKLDVLHGGATGIRCKSSGTFSVIDIDGANGDAALRFAKAGVNQWNTRNNPATDDYQIFELGGGGERFQIQNGTGNVGIGRAPTANKLEVEGDASKATAGDWAANSDRRIKEDIQPIGHALETLERVRLVDFRYTEQYRLSHPSIADKRYMNVIAQEFAEVFPDHVKSSGEKLPDGSAILQVDTYPLTIYTAAAVQELARKLDAKNDQIARLMAENAAMKDQLAAQAAKDKAIEARLARLEQAAPTGTVPVKVALRK